MRKTTCIKTVIGDVVACLKLHKFTVFFPLCNVLLYHYSASSILLNMLHLREILTQIRSAVLTEYIRTTLKTQLELYKITWLDLSVGWILYGVGGGMKDVRGRWKKYGKEGKKNLEIGSFTAQHV